MTMPKTILAKRGSHQIADGVWDDADNLEGELAEPDDGEVLYVRAEAERAAWNAAIEAAAAKAKLHNLGRCYEMSQRQLDAILALKKGDPT